MKELEGFKVDVKRVGPIQHVIIIQPSGQNYGLITQVNHPAPISEDEAFEYFKREKKNFVIDLPV